MDRMYIYRRSMGTQTWHWNAHCTKWPDLHDYEQVKKLPHPQMEQFCAECLRVSDAAAHC